MVVGSLNLIVPFTVESKILLQIVRVTQSKAAMSDTADFYKLRRKYCNTNALNTNPKPEECGYRNGAKTNDCPKPPKRITGKNISVCQVIGLPSKWPYPCTSEKPTINQYSLAVT